MAEYHLMNVNCKQNTLFHVLQLILKTNLFMQVQEQEKF